MAKILVCAVDQGHPDPVKDNQRYKQGDIVVIYSDSYVFQGAEGLPMFWQFTVLNLLGDDSSNFLEEGRTDPIFPKLLTRRRKRFVDITQLSQQAQNSLAADGTATVVRLAFLAALTPRP